MAESRRSVKLGMTRYTRNDRMKVVLLSVKCKRLRPKCGKDFEHEVTEQMEDNGIKQHQHGNIASK